MKINKDYLAIFLGLSGLLISSILVRYFTFGFSTLDWDEVTYVIMGEGLRNGFIPFVDLWDIKPIGLYSVYAIFNGLFGYSMVTVRLATLIFTVASALLIFFTFKRFNVWVALILSLFYQLSFSYLFSGLSGNTEVFFLFFQILGIYFLIKKNRILHWLGFLSIGLAFIIKYIIIFDIALITFSYIFIRFVRNKYKFNQNFVVSIMPSLAIIIPFLFVGFIYFIIGHWGEYWETIIITSSQYSISRTLWEKISFLKSFFFSKIFAFPLLFLISISLFNKTNISKLYALNKITIFGLVWFIGALVGSTWTGYNYEHYLLALIPGYLLFMGGLFFSINRRAKKYNAFFVLIFLSGIIASYWEGQKVKNMLKDLPDTPKHISLDLKAESIQSLFIASGMHTPYVLLNIYPPIKYPQPYNYQSENFAKKIGIDPLHIMQEVEEKKVDAIQFCDKTNDKFSSEFYDRVKNDYYLFREYFPNCELYLRFK